MQAYEQYKTVIKAVAFNVTGYSRKRKVNQHLVIYTFPDNSELYIYKSGKALVPHVAIGIISCLV